MRHTAEPLQQVDRVFVRWHGRRLLYFAGCDYHRLASHPRVLAAARRGLKQFGLNVAASRKTTGNHSLYEELERALARFFQAERAVLVSNGYLTNLAVAQALCGEFTHALVDVRSHASLADAAFALEATVVPFAHRQPADLKKQLGKLGNRTRPIVCTDGMFSHDGSAAPLAEYLAALPANALLLVDDSHGAGVLGPAGRGTPSHCHVRDARVIQTITLSKALGAFGGAILGVGTHGAAFFIGIFKAVEHHVVVQHAMTDAIAPTCLGDEIRRIGHRLHAAGDHDIIGACHQRINTIDRRLHR